MNKTPEIHGVTRISIDSDTPSKSLGSKHTLSLIGEPNTEISKIETKLERIMGQISSLILAFLK